jgi:hypothetical protein
MRDRRLKLRHCEQTRIENTPILILVRFSDDIFFGNRSATLEFSMGN